MQFIFHWNFYRYFHHNFPFLSMGFFSYFFSLFVNERGIIFNLLIVMGTL